MTCFKTGDGKTLRKHCINIGLPYRSVYTFLEMGMSIDDSIKEAQKRKGNRYSHPKYRIGSVSLADSLGSGTAKYQRVLKMIHNGISINNAVSAEGVL